MVKNAFLIEKNHIRLFDICLCMRSSFFRFVFCTFLFSSFRFLNCKCSFVFLFLYINNCCLTYLILKFSILLFRFILISFQETKLLVEMQFFFHSNHS